MERVKVAHLVKSEDLNHHGTLFAGRMAEWFVEACFIHGAQVTMNPEGLVCLNIHGLRFQVPANRGDIIHIEARVVRAGKSSLVIYGRATRNNDTVILADGFVTFVNIDKDGKPLAHNINLTEPTDENEANLRQRAEELLASIKKAQE